MGIKRHRPEEIERANPDTLYRVFGTPIGATERSSPTNCLRT